MPQSFRISDIARHAGVSTATVDRVLNDRANVRESTRQRVLQARDALAAGTAISNRARPWRIKVILPRNAGPSTEYFAQCMQRLGSRGHATIECEFAVKMEPVALARKLRGCLGQHVDAIAFQALEDPRVAQAVGELKQAGIACATVLSDMDHADLIGHVGSDNRAAGRTAGLMMGHMAHTPGEILIVTSGDLYRAHEDREIGFRAVVRSDFPQLKIATSLIGRDDQQHTCAIVSEALQQHRAVVGIYNVGAGNRAIARALHAASMANEIVFIGHNLTSTTHAFLLDGSMNAVIHQNLSIAASDTLQLLLDHLNGQTPQQRKIAVEIITRENTEGVAFGH